MQKKDSTAPLLLLALLEKCVPDQGITSSEEAQALLLRNFRVGGEEEDERATWLTEMIRALLAPVPFREVFVILALFLPQLTFAEGAKPASRLWASPAIQRNDYEVQVAPLAKGLRGMREYHIAFPAWSNAAAFCHPSLQVMEFGQLIENPYRLPGWQSVPNCAGRSYRSVCDVGCIIGVRPPGQKENPA